MVSFIWMLIRIILQSYTSHNLRLSQKNETHNNKIKASAHLSLIYISFYQFLFKINNYRYENSMVNGISLITVITVYYLYTVLLLTLAARGPTLVVRI